MHTTSTTEDLPDNRKRMKFEMNKSSAAVVMGAGGFLLTTIAVFALPLKKGGKPDAPAPPSNSSGPDNSPTQTRQSDAYTSRAPKPQTEENPIPPIGHAPSHLRTASDNESKPDQTVKSKLTKQQKSKNELKPIHKIYNNHQGHRVAAKTTTGGERNCLTNPVGGNIAKPEVKLLKS